MWLDWYSTLETFAPSLCLAFAHSLWQGAIWCVALAIVLRCLPTSQPTLRYTAGLVCFFGLAVGVCVTLSVLRLPQMAVESIAPEPASTASLPNSSNHDSPVLLSTPNREQSSPPEGREPAPAKTAPREVSVDSGIREGQRLATTSPSKLPTWFRNASPVLFGIWMIGAAVFLFKSILDWHSVQQLCRGQAITDTLVTEKLERLKRLLGIKKIVTLLSSERASSPFVIGVLQPVIVIPSSLLTGMTPDQWNMLLGHELAHVRRWDYLVNLLQLLVEAMLFFNPAVWWLSRRVRIEREACCDAWGVRVVDSPLAYATALMEIGERLSSPLAPAFAAKDSGSLLDRVRRIVTKPHQDHVRFHWPLAIALLLLGILLVVCVQRGSDMAVTVAAQVLSDEQRVTELAKAAQAISPLPSTETYAVSGSVTTEDGAPLPKIIQVTSVVNKESSTSMSSQHPIETDKSSQFRFELGPGTGWLLFHTDEYAPAIAGPFHDNSGRDNVIVKLKRGVSATLRVNDEKGQPVSGASVSTMISIANVRSSGPVVSALTDADGQFVLKHVDPEQRVHLSFTAPGFQLRSLGELKLKANQVLEVEMSRAQRVAGRIVSADGNPIEGAELFALRNRSPGATVINGFLRQPLCKTNAQGVFELTELLDGHTYDFAIRHPQHGITYLRDVAPGKQDLHVQLPKPISIVGSIRGNEEQLERLSKSYVAAGLELAEEAPYQSEPLEVQWPLQLTRTNGKAEFSIDGVAPGNLILYAGDQRFKQPITANNRELSFDLSTPPTESQRPIRIVFTLDGKPVIPSGKVRISLNGRESEQWNDLQVSNLVDGSASLSTRVPCNLSLNSEQMLGFAPEDNHFMVQVSAGTDELTISVPVRPAGAVRGRVRLADGSPASGCSVSVNATLVSGSVVSGRRETLFGIHTTTNSNGEFFATPIPFGARCELSASQDKNVQIGESFILDEQNALPEFDLQLAQPVSATIRVTDEQGNALRGLPISLSLEHPRKSTSWSPPEFTNPQGEVTIDAVNPDLLAYFVAKVQPIKDYQTTNAKLNANNRMTEIRLAPGRVIEGILLDAASRPLAGQEMIAVRTASYERFSAETKTDDQGYFRISNLPDGEFHLQTDRFSLGSDLFPSYAADEVQTMEVRIK